MHLLVLWDLMFYHWFFGFALYLGNDNNIHPLPFGKLSPNSTNSILRPDKPCNRYQLFLAGFGGKFMDGPEKK